MPASHGWTGGALTSGARAGAAWSPSMTRRATAARYGTTRSSDATVPPRPILARAASGLMLHCGASVQRYARHGPTVTLRIRGLRPRCRAASGQKLFNIDALTKRMGIAHLAARRWSVSEKSLLEPLARSLAWLGDDDLMARLSRLVELRQHKHLFWAPYPNSGLNVRV